MKSRNPKGICNIAHSLTGYNQLLLKLAKFNFPANSKPIPLSSFHCLPSPGHYPLFLGLFQESTNCYVIFHSDSPPYHKSFSELQQVWSLQNRNHNHVASLTYLKHFKGCPLISGQRPKFLARFIQSDGIIVGYLSGFVPVFLYLFSPTSLVLLSFSRNHIPSCLRALTYFAETFPYQPSPH